MPKKAENIRLMKLLMLALGVLVVALIVVLIVMLAGGGSSGEDKENAFVEEHKYLNGVSVGGVDISGLTFDEAAANAQLQALGKQTEDGFSYTFTVNGKEYTFTAADLGITSNLLPVLQEAMLYGQYGGEAGAQRKEMNEDGGKKDFALAPFGDVSLVTAKLTELKATTLDVMPQDATVVVPDGVQGDPNAKYLYELAGVQIIDEVVGVDVDAAGLAALICGNINSGNYASVEAPAILTNPEINAEDVKANTKLLSRFDSDFSEGSLAAADRVTNITVLSGIVNGTIIQPGETWSINTAAGPRNATTAKEMGWAEAPGITNGRYEDQYGGGVCQVSGTLYNAAIRAELSIVKRYIHSWPSSYVPKGLDATINYPSGDVDGNGSKDLQLSNPFDMPVYIVAYVGTDKTLTVEIYGPPLSHGYTVDFVTIKVNSDKAAPTEMHYDAAADPGGTAITAGKSREWVTSRDGQTWQVWKQYLDESGNVVKSVFYSEDTYRSFQGVTYVNGQNPLYVDKTAAPTG